MTGEKDKEKLIFFIKNYYKKKGETPSMKTISEACEINSRVFYKLFKSQKEAFEIAGVPYSDEKRIKVVSANIARKKKSGIEVVSEKETIYVVDKNRLNNRIIKNITYIGDDIRFKIANMKNEVLESNPEDSRQIEIAYIQAKNMIDAFITDSIQLYYEYKRCKILINAPNDFEKILYVEKGFNFDDVEGSYEKIKYKMFQEKLSRYDPTFDSIASFYFREFFRV